MIINGFLERLGLDEKESKIFLSTMRFGAQPTSVIARHAKIDRTTAHRILKKLCAKKLIAESKQKGITVYYVEKLSDIEHYIEKESDKFKKLHEEFENLVPQFEALSQGVQELPRIQIYDGYDRLEQFYHDVIIRAVEQKLLYIRILGSNTFSQQLERKDLGELAKTFEKELKKHQIKSEVLIAQGNLTREWITRLSTFEQMANLPAAGGATNVILVGESIFMVSFRDFPVGVRIDHPDLAQTMHFLFDMNNKR